MIKNIEFFYLCSVCGTNCQVGTGKDENGNYVDICQECYNNQENETSDVEIFDDHVFDDALHSRVTYDKLKKGNDND